jgi:hypothetical protein
MKLLNLLLGAGLCLAIVSCHHGDVDPIVTPPATGDSLILSLQLNNNLTDASAQHNNGNLFGASHFATGRHGDANGAIELQRADSNRVEITGNVYNDLNRYTIYMEFMPYDATDMMLISRTMYQINPDMHQGFGLMTNFPVGYGSRFITKAAGQCDNIVTATAFASPFLGTQTPTVNSWNWMAVTFDGVTTRMYLNNVLVASGNGVGTSLCHGAPLQLGAWFISEPHFFNGRIDQVRIYNGVLSSTQLQALYL